MAAQLLPAFAALEPFVDYWAVPGTQARRERREAASMAEISAFYTAMLEVARDAIRHLEGRALDELPPEDVRLMELLLALAHASMATELHGQPRAPHTPYPHDVRLVEGVRLFS
ncbi:hypothetical protein [Novosphingobium sp. 9U]|uniref:hypothetical protein n=1 Tax=Novosphingobium sp. 9U TaxID=2653158 RepID=UPI00135C9ECE|nr:hypothetical protein [Novosphingobium sp. 9U]